MPPRKAPAKPKPTAAAARRAQRAAKKARDDAARALAERAPRMLALRVAGATPSMVAGEFTQQGTPMTPGQAASEIAAALAARASELEVADPAAALELERLDRLERRASVVLDAAATRQDHGLVLRAVDRLVLISERRASIAPAGQAGDTERAVGAELAKLPAFVRDSAAAKAALLLARRLDAGLPASDVTSVSRELRITMAGLAGLAPADAPESLVDDLRDRRAQRLSNPGGTPPPAATGKAGS